MSDSQNDRISIQVSLSGYSFRIEDRAGVRFSGWRESGTLFATPELHAHYGIVELSLMTPKCALIPERFYDASSCRELLAETVQLGIADEIAAVELPQFAAVLVYSPTIGDSLSKAIKATLSEGGAEAELLPEMYWVLRDLMNCGEYNKIIASYAEGWLYLAIAQGRTLQLANVYSAPDFTTAEFFIFSAMKSLQLNPEMSCISFRTPLDAEEEMSLYRYFRTVERI